MLNSVSRSRSGVGRVSKPGSVFTTRLRNSPAMTRILTHLHQPVSPLPVRLDVSHGVAKHLGIWWVLDKCHCFRARGFQDLAISKYVGDSQRRQARLLGP